MAGEKEGAAAPQKTKFVRLRPPNPDKGLHFRTYSARGQVFRPGEWVEAEEAFADYLGTVENPVPKGAEKGAPAFEVSARKPKD